MLIKRSNYHHKRKNPVPYFAGFNPIAAALDNMYW